ncbi:MAG: thioesterase, FlK family [Planctomycetota bacterium]|jgi:enoyl-CoA hydratase/carnithine racemase/predicted thioesterase
MKEGLQIHHSATLELVVGSAESIHLGATDPGGGVTVFCTPAMINLMEHAARHALAPYLEPGEESVGVTVDIRHLAATPIGAEVRAVARVTNIEKRQIDFVIEAYDGQDKIGEGRHRRAVIRLDRIQPHIQKKAAELTGAGAIPMNIEPDTGPLPPFQTLIVETEGPVTTVTLNRPQRLNSVDTVMTSEFERLVRWLAGRGEEIRVVVLTGAGRSFCSGDDVRELPRVPIDQATALSHRQAKMYLAIERLPQIFIAAVNGDALGGGCVMAYSCDMRIASQSANFGMPEILLGWPPGYGLAQLTALVGKARALELCTTGQPISAKQALEYGLINRVVPGMRLMAEVKKVTDTLLATPPVALRETKRLIHQDEGAQPKTAFLADTASYIQCLQTDDAKEGLAAFAEKRKPKFSPR